MTVGFEAKFARREGAVTHRRGLGRRLAAVVAAAGLAMGGIVAVAAPAQAVQPYVPPACDPVRNVVAPQDGPAEGVIGSVWMSGPNTVVQSLFVQGAVTDPRFEVWMNTADPGAMSVMLHRSSANSLPDWPTKYGDGTITRDPSSDRVLNPGSPDKAYAYVISFPAGTTLPGDPAWPGSSFSLTFSGTAGVGFAVSVYNHWIDGASYLLLGDDLASVQGHRLWYEVFTQAACEPETPPVTPGERIVDQTQQGTEDGANGSHWVTDPSGVGQSFIVTSALKDPKIEVWLDTPDSGALQAQFYRGMAFSTPDYTVKVADGVITRDPAADTRLNAGGEMAYGYVISFPAGTQLWTCESYGVNFVITFTNTAGIGFAAAGFPHWLSGQTKSVVGNPLEPVEGQRLWYALFTTA